MIINTRNYKKIIKYKNKYKFSDFDLISNYGLFSGDTNLFKTLTVFEILMSLKDKRGDIIEFGVHNGNNSILIKKILDIYKIKKKLYLVDHFKGLIHFIKNKDPKKSLIFKNKYAGKLNILKSFISFFKFKNIFIIKKDVTNIKNDFFKNKIFCLAYFDLDLYLPTKKTLSIIKKKIIKNGLIVFDQGNKDMWGEKKAIKEFLQENKNFKLIKIPFSRQPDIILKKI